MPKDGKTSTRGLYAFFALACAITWLSAAPAALAFARSQTPAPLAIAGAGLSAFGPLLAALIVAGRRKELREVFGKWRTHPAWIVLALLAPAAVHLIATALYAACGGHVTQWFHPPRAPEQLAALVVFPIGEEFGWRGFAHGRAAERHGLVKGSLLVGFMWGLWHLMYSSTPTSAGFDGFVFALTMLELPLYALLFAWLFERANRSMAVAIAFHAGGHLDHFELVPRSEWRLHAVHMVVVAVIAFFAARSLSRAEA